MIYVHPIAERDARYTTPESRDICLYSIGEGGQLLTLGQLLIAVGCRHAAALESRSVLTMNVISGRVRLMRRLSACLEAATNAAESETMGSVKVVLEDGTKKGLRDCLVNDCGINGVVLPAGGDLLIPANKVRVMDAVKVKMDDASNESQRDNVSLRSLVSARDVAYRTVTSLTRGYCAAGTDLAQFLR